MSVGRLWRKRERESFTKGWVGKERIFDDAAVAVVPSVRICIESQGIKNESNKWSSHRPWLQSDF